MKTQSAHFALGALLAINFGFQSACLGQGTIYRDRSEFEAALSGTAGTRTDIIFDGPFPPGGFVVEGEVRGYFPPLTVSDLTFHSGGVLLIRTFADGNRWLNNYDSLTPLGVVMNGPALAFGADFSSFLRPDYTSFLATATLNDGRVFTFTAPADPNFTFWGIVTSQPFSSLTFSDGGLIGIAGYHEEILDNITVVSVPEPGVCALLALGGLLLGWRWGRKRVGKPM